LATFVLRKEEFLPKEKCCLLVISWGKTNSFGEAVLNFYVEPQIPVLNRKEHTIPVPHKMELGIQLWVGFLNPIMDQHFC
jgi:hypothetical protein